MANKRKFKPPRERDRKKEAMTRLRVQWEKDHEDQEFDPGSEPVITPLLKAVAGGIPSVIEALRAHDDDDAEAFLETYDSLNATDRGLIPIEAIAFASGIGSLRLAEITQTALFMAGQLRTNLLLSSHLPAVLEKSLKLAKTTKGVADREMMLKAGKILPIPKGSQFTFNIPDGSDKELPDNPNKALPIWRSSEDRLKEFQSLTEPKRLPSPESKPMTLGGHVDQLQAETVEIIRGDNG